MNTSEFFKDKKAVILDDKRIYRHYAREALANAGVELKNIHAEKSYSNAFELVVKIKPEIIISEFEVGDQYGLNLANEQLSYTEDPLQKLFMVIADNSMQSAVADAAEEEVDAFIVKPFDQEKVADYLDKAAARKLNPSEYLKNMIDIKAQLSQGNFDNAYNLANFSKFITSQPAMCYYFCGEIFRQQEKYRQALDEFEGGLEKNPIHYKCLQGKFITLKHLKYKEEAYRTIEKISEKFPLTPTLLKEAFIFSILSYHYKDIEKYFDMYSKLPRKTDDLKATVSQALLTGGKLLMKNYGQDEGMRKKSLDFFKKGAIISGRMEGYLENVVNYLIENGQANECQYFLEMFSFDEVARKTVESLRFKSQCHLNYTQSDLIKRGQELIFNDLGDLWVIKKVCQLLKDNKSNPKLIESIVYKAVKLYPDQRKKLMAILGD